MSDEAAIEKRTSDALRKKAPAVLTFGVAALMLYVIGFPVFLLAFFGALAFFVWKVFTSESRTETRRIFEFYLVANEIVRDDDRRWFGFEMREAAERGESILRSMPTAPPLVHFVLGALYQKAGDHAAGVRHLSLALEGASSDESAIVCPSSDLREYARMLRRIERSPAEAPLTASAVRSLERVRRNRGAQMLESSRAMLAAEPAKELIPQRDSAHGRQAIGSRSVLDADDEDDASSHTVDPRSPDDRKTISEVLQDIYDTKIQ